MEDFLKAVANFGFPIVVAGYLLIKMEKIMEKNTSTIRDLSETIKDLCQLIKK